jgi:hypothetical protein
MNEENKKPGLKWYHKPVWIFVAILAAGPLALPMVWTSPALKRWHKILISLALVLFTIWLVKASMDIFQSLLKEMKELQGILQ